MAEYGNFSFLMDTEIVFGRGAEAEAGRLVKKHGGSKALLVYGGGSVKRSGLLGRVVASLEGADVAFAELGGVHANPRRSFAEAGARRALDEGVDFVLAIGGGSAIDTAKAISLGAVPGADGTFWQYFRGAQPKRSLPVGAVPTIAAAGSETSRSAVIVDDIDSGDKVGLWYDPYRPRFAILNPELTFTVPAAQTAAGSADIFAHVVMRYFTPWAGALSDRFGEATMRTVVEFARRVVETPDDYAARAELLLCASFAHNDLSFVGKPEFASGEHGLEQQLSGYYDFPHGAGLAVIMPAMLAYFLRHGSEEQAARVARFGREVFGAETAEEG
ncbi:MAG: iron-containing alcohol dehydrogenase, partial [Clostridiales Family XIII bacterium]|nr:iron-containing alcohol dehydrogenase [Clostridiales Family XIII bacterium]